MVGINGTQRALTQRMKLDAFALTITGRRTNNEDAICARPELGLYIVADGMGGYEGGEVASALAIDAIFELVRRTAGEADVTWPYAIDAQRSPGENELLVATRLANDRIAVRRVGELREMGSTVVALRIAGDRAVVAHVGDSRLYRLRAGALAQLTVDHSLAAELAASGMPVDANFQWRHVVTRALGTKVGEPERDPVPTVVRRRRVLCCSTDGLSEVPFEPEGRSSRRSLAHGRGRVPRPGRCRARRRLARQHLGDRRARGEVGRQSVIRAAAAGGLVDAHQSVTAPARGEQPDTRRPYGERPIVRRSREQAPAAELLPAVERDAR